MFFIFLSIFNFQIEFILTADKVNSDHDGTNILCFSVSDETGILKAEDTNNQRINLIIEYRETPKIVLNTTKTPSIDLEKTLSNLDLSKFLSCRNEDEKILENFLKSKIENYSFQENLLRFKKMLKK